MRHRTLLESSLAVIRQIMPQRDAIHNIIRQALLKEGWEITDDPYVISYGERFLFIDLAARLDVVNGIAGRFIRARRGSSRIVVEINEFRGNSAIADLEQAIGQYVLYRLSEGKVWVEYDGMEQGITKDLIAAGIPLERIVLAFLPEEQTAATA
jgi:hypothetical protein